MSTYDRHIIARGFGNAPSIAVDATMANLLGDEPLSFDSRDEHAVMAAAVQLVVRGQELTPEQRERVRWALSEMRVEEPYEDRRLLRSGRQ